ncbi:MAG: Riboflavin transporter [Alphaproteobacteria bacterium MarineAlpha9_Bin2]|nr:MAG: Riboflavin transporter [Alphaproteobacteria bacterium MarineAlpha9_Bin2]
MLKNILSLWTNLPNNIQGFIFILGASASFPVMGTIVKHLTEELHPFQIAFFRCFFGLLIIMPLFLNKPIKIFQTKKFKMHFYRGLLGIGAITAGFTALAMMPLASAVTLGFTRILFLVPLAMIVLGERPGFIRIILTFLGFLGVAIMVDPSSENGVSISSACVALIGAFFVSAVKLSVKSLSSTEPTLTIQFYYGIISSLGLIIPAYIFWLPMRLEHLILILLGALFGTLGQMFTIWGLRIGNITVVMPADYTRLIFAGIYGYFLFAEIPNINEFLGAIIIISSTLIILFRSNFKN